MKRTAGYIFLNIHIYMQPDNLVTHLNQPFWFKKMTNDPWPFTYRIHSFNVLKPTKSIYSCMALQYQVRLRAKEWIINVKISKFGHINKSDHGQVLTSWIKRELERSCIALRLNIRAMQVKTTPTFGTLGDEGLYQTNKTTGHTKMSLQRICISLN